MSYLTLVDLAVEPQQCASLLFIIQENCILLIRKKRGVGAGKISAPGGKQEIEECPITCAIRETQEELCINPIDPTLVGINYFKFPDDFTMLQSVFLAYEFEGVPTETDEAIPLWSPLKNIPFAQMWDDTRLWLPKIITGFSCFGQYIFDAKKLTRYNLTACKSVL